MFRSIRAQLFSIILVLTILILVSTITLFVFLNDHTADEAVSSIFEYEKSLIQQMTWLAFSSGNTKLAPYREIFDQNLQSLQKGGEGIDSNGKTILLSPSDNATIQANLDGFSHSWVDYQESLNRISLFSQDDPARGEALRALQADSLRIINEFQSISTIFLEQEKAEHLNLMYIQFGFLIIAVVLIPISLYILNRRFLDPLLQLNHSALRIGEGNLTEPVVVRGDDEIGQLARSFDAMRLEIVNQQKMLETRIEERSRALIIANEFSRYIVRQVEIEQLLRLVTQQACDLLTADQATLCLLKPDGTRMETVYQNGELLVKATVLDHQLAATYFRPGDADQVLAIEATCTSCALYKSYDPQRCVVANLQVGNTSYGALCVARISGQPIDSIEKRTLILLANSATMAIHIHFLLDDVRKNAELAATLAEKERIAAELHDNLAQSLGLLGIKVDVVRELVSTGKSEAVLAELDSIGAINNSAYTQLRVTLDNLTRTDEPIDHVYQDLENFLAEYQLIPQLHVELSLPVSWAAMLTPLQHKQAMHIIREALTNVRRHAQATSVKVGMYENTHKLSIFIEDNGIGFEPSQVESGKHLGLEIMRTRAERCCGKLAIRSAPTQGTRIELSFPLKRGAIPGNGE